MNSQEAFVLRLRRTRERYGITLDQIAASTRIKRELLDAFERNDLSAWPRGVYARAWVRAYAEAIGVDPSETVGNFCRLFPHGDRRMGTLVQDLAAVLAHTSQYRDEFNHTAERRSSALDVPPAPPAWWEIPVGAVRTSWARMSTAFRGLASLRFRRAPRAALDGR